MTKCAVSTALMSISHPQLYKGHECVCVHRSKSKTKAAREQLTLSITTVSHYVRRMGEDSKGSRVFCIIRMCLILVCNAKIIKLWRMAL